MTVEEKRELLTDFCETHERCEGCILEDDDYDCMFYCSEPYEIDKVYDKVFPSPKATETSEPPKEDVVNHPNHYTNGGMECIDEMILIFGKEATMNFCLCNAWKYRRRALYKNQEEDMQKSHWYINKYKELKESLEHVTVRSVPYAD